jgi:hypothetical protein
MHIRRYASLHVSAVNLRFALLAIVATSYPISELSQVNYLLFILGLIQLARMSHQAGWLAEFRRIHSHLNNAAMK